MYKHLENGEGLPMDGFKFYWNPETGTSSNQWQSLAYTSTPFVKTGRYDVLYSGNRDFQTSQPGKFIVKMALLIHLLLLNLMQVKLQSHLERSDKSRLRVVAIMLNQMLIKS